MPANVVDEPGRPLARDRTRPASAGDGPPGGKTARVAVVVAWIVGFLAVRFLLISGRELVEAPALERVNYRGRVIFTAAGLRARDGRADRGGGPVRARGDRTR